MISEMCVKYGSSGVKGQRPLRFLGDPKGAILTLRMALFEIAAAGGCIGGHLWTGIPYGLVSLMELAAHRGDHPIGPPPNGSPESLPARPTIKSVRAKVLPAAKRLYAALAAYVELA